MMLSEITTTIKQKEVFDLYRKGVDAVNYLITELNFADMDTDKGAGVLVNQAHCDARDALDRLAKIALHQKPTKQQEGSCS